MSSPSLPPVYQSLLDHETYDALFRDWGLIAEGVQVTVKRGGSAYVDECESWELARARAALEAAEIRAIQVRYRHESVDWVDTLLSVGAGFRLVRMAQPSAL